MCPEISTLSAYYDGEIEGAAAAAIAEHISQCSLCGAIIEGYRRLSGNLATSMVDVEPIALRSREHIATRAAIVGRNRAYLAVRIPTPVVAFAAILIVVLSVGFLTSRLQYVGQTRIASRSSASLFDEIVEYLESRQPVEPVTFRLPANTELHIEGEPMLIRESEYRRALQ